ncbi:hypothetical protein N9191_01855, partial [bacterium]|nr:hypothetical protein [bacterium]
GAVTNTKLGSSSVTSAKILNGTITGADIATGTVESADIKDSTITGSDISNGTITASDIATGGVAGNDIADNTILFGKLAPGVGAPHMSTSSHTKTLFATTALTANAVTVKIEASDYGLPTSGVDGAILKVFMTSLDVANLGSAVIFWGSNYAFAPTGNTVPYLCNSVVTVGGYTTSGTGQVFCPLKYKGSGVYEFKMKCYRRTSWNSSLATVVIGIIGYY